MQAKPKKIINLLLESKTKRLKLFAVLIDPDKHNFDSLTTILKSANQGFVDLILIGGSLITTEKYNYTLNFFKDKVSVPVVLFPGNYHAIHTGADGILLLNLISGRNPEYLIGQHVVAAPILANTELEVLSTSYILIDGGKPTTVSYISGTLPIPSDKPEIALATAMAGEMIGHKITFLDCGSGAENAIASQTIEIVSNKISNIIFVGGGISSAKTAREKWLAGADVVVVGTAIELDNNSIEAFYRAKP